jgi:hypothetical protein
MIMSPTLPCILIQEISLQHFTWDHSWMHIRSIADALRPQRPHTAVPRICITTIWIVVALLLVAAQTLPALLTVVPAGCSCRCCSFGHTSQWPPPWPSLEGSARSSLQPGSSQPLHRFHLYLVPLHPKCPLLPAICPGCTSPTPLPCLRPRVPFCFPILI